MSPKIKFSFVLYSLLVILILEGCKKESAFRITAKPEILIGGFDARFASNEIMFSKDTVYVIGSSIRINNGQTLLIEPGTLIKVNGSAAGISINIEPGGKIEATGTMTEPIVFTSSANFGRAGQTPNYDVWNGIRITGSALLPNSGTMSYVRIEFAGAYTSSLYLSNVGSQTTINNIQVSYSFNRPSFEFSAGNVNASNLVAYASSGTDFILNNGYKGKLQNLLGYRLPFYAATIQNLGGMLIQGANTLPVISNVTLLGPETRYGINGSYLSGGNQRRAGLITIEGAKFRIRNSLITAFPLRGYYLDGKSTAESIEKLESDISYTIMHHPDSTAFYLPSNVYPPYTAADLTSFLLQSRFGNQLLPPSASIMLTDPFNYYDNFLPNPMPKEGSPLLTGADFNSPHYTDPFFRKVLYRGALGAENWLDGWTNFSPLTTDYNY